MSTKKKRRPKNLYCPVAAAVGRQRLAGQILDLRLAVYTRGDGEQDRETLARLAWMIGVGAEVAHNKAPRSTEAKRLHAALRVVVQMASEGGHWQASQVNVIDEAVTIARGWIERHATVAIAMADGANGLAAKIRAGTARLDDVAGAELYAEVNHANA